MKGGDTSKLPPFLDKVAPWDCQSTSLFSHHRRGRVIGAANLLQIRTGFRP